MVKFWNRITIIGEKPQAAAEKIHYSITFSCIIVWMSLRSAGPSS